MIRAAVLSCTPYYRCDADSDCHNEITATPNTPILLDYDVSVDEMQMAATKTRAKIVLCNMWCDMIMTVTAYRTDK